MKNPFSFGISKDVKLELKKTNFNLLDTQYINEFEFYDKGEYYYILKKENLGVKFIFIYKFGKISTLDC